MLKVFTDSSYTGQQHRKMIFPLLFDICYVHNQRIMEYYPLVSTIEEADIAIVPVDIGYYFTHGRKRELYDFIENASELGKKVWVYTAGDVGITLGEGVYTFRMGGFHRNFGDHTFTIPSFIPDPYTHTLHREFSALEKASHPHIGFVGHADGSLMKYIKEFLIFAKHNLDRFCGKKHVDFQAFYPSSYKRFKYLRRLQDNKDIRTDFILRAKYRANAVTSEQRKTTELDFFENMYNNPYTFCLRGAGNFSVRLYETLAMGRIPVVIDTDIGLPLHEKIDWQKHLVIAKPGDFMEKLIAFHNNTDAQLFKEIQLANRLLWKETLSREGYLIGMHDLFNAKLKSETKQ